MGHGAELSIGAGHAETYPMGSVAGAWLQPTAADAPCSDDTAAGSGRGAAAGLRSHCGSGSASSWLD